MSRKNKREWVRACLRCGCTEERACGCGCEWVAGSNVCSACLTPQEHALWIEMAGNLSAADNALFAAKNQLVHARTQQNLFGNLLNAGGAR